MAATAYFGSEKTAVLKVYEGLSRSVLRTDMFHYLEVFLEGGVYANSDTSGVVFVSGWGRKEEILQYWTDPTLLRLKAEALRLTYGDSRQPRPRPVNEEPPALSVAFETGSRGMITKAGTVHSTPLPLQQDTPYFWTCASTSWRYSVP